FIKEKIKWLKQQKLIVSSHNSWISSALVVEKANRKFCLVIDYRQSNKVIKPDTNPLPKISDMLDALTHIQDRLDECQEECYQIRESLEGAHENITEGEFTYDELKQKLHILGLTYIAWRARNLRQAQILNVEFNTARIAWRNQRDRNRHIAQKLQNCQDTRQIYTRRPPDGYGVNFERYIHADIINPTPSTSQIMESLANDLYKKLSD
ncbi:2658_t:CDS:2, partial [Diversispora eburnea]